MPDATPSLSVVVPATNAPPTLGRCLAAIERAMGPEDELVVVAEPRDARPGCARNLGGRRASRDVVVFVDADVEVHPDSLVRIRSAFAAEPDLTALFGSYDDAPGAPGVVSAFRNLLHHHVHHSSPGPASTFWTGLGAVRRDAFLTVGGFDPEQPFMEDIDLGMRLDAAGARIELRPDVQGKHLKAWSLAEMVRTDFTRRGIPWVGLLLRYGASSSLNLGWRHRASAGASVLALAALVTRRRALGAASLVSLVVLNHSFYRLLARRQGPAHAVAGVGLHALHHVTSVASIPAGVVAHVWKERRRRRR